MPQWPLDALAEASKRIIAWNQHPSGGYVASPLFSHYAFSWLRDGSFIAYGMDCAGEHESAALFYGWVARIMESKRAYIDSLADRQRRGEYIHRHEFLHTRYHLDGRDDNQSEWGHFQLDGYGAWLWGLAEHLRASGLAAVPDRYRTAVDATITYLRAFWPYPNFDCWEEYPDHVHPSTLACLYGGLKRIAELDGDASLHELAEQIRQFLLEHAVLPDEGRFVKYITPVPGDSPGYVIGHSGVDASLLWLAEPFGVFAPDHPVMAATIRRIAADLRTPQGGLRRYADDTYYGGGEWLLLTAWYGLVQLAAGDRAAAEEAAGWIAGKTDALGRLPEQVPDALADRSEFERWVERWGTPALPLLWSHAMYLVLYRRLFAGTAPHAD